MEVNEIETAYQPSAALAHEILSRAERGLKRDLKQFDCYKPDNDLLMDLGVASDTLEEHAGTIKDFDQRTLEEIEALGDVLERDCSPGDKMFSKLGEDAYDALRSLHRKLINGEIIVLEEV